MGDSNELTNTRILNSNDDAAVEFQIRPPNKKRFSKDLAKEIIHDVLNEELSNKVFKPDKPDEMGTLCKSIIDLLKKKLKPLGAGYKLIFEVVLGEQRGAGIKYVARCFWDSGTDAIVSTSFENDTMFCVATVCAVYYY